MKVGKRDIFILSDKLSNVNRKLKTLKVKYCKCSCCLILKNGTEHNLPTLNQNTIAVGQKGKSKIFGGRHFFKECLTVKQGTSWLRSML